MRRNQLGSGGLRRPNGSCCVVEARGIALGQSSDDGVFFGEARRAPRADSRLDQDLSTSLYNCSAPVAVSSSALISASMPSTTDSRVSPFKSARARPRCPGESPDRAYCHGRPAAWLPAGAPQRVCQKFMLRGGELVLRGQYLNRSLAKTHPRIRRSGCLCTLVGTRLVGSRIQHSTNRREGD
jgi:hypothetical protein